MLSNPNDTIPTRQSLLERLKNWEDHTSWQDFFNTYLYYIAPELCGQEKVTVVVEGDEIDEECHTQPIDVKIPGLVLMMMPLRKRNPPRFLRPSSRLVLQSFD